MFVGCLRYRSPSGRVGDLLATWRRLPGVKTDGLSARNGATRLVLHL